MAAFGAQAHDPLVFAIPFFAAFIGLEILSLRLFSDDTEVRGYSRPDTITNLIMGVGSVVINSGARLVALLGYVALYAWTPLRLDPHEWWTWVVVLLAVDLIWYSYHRASHRVRLLWAAHQAHHNSVYFNLSTAVRQKWNPWFELLFWTPLPLLGVPPWLIFTAFSINLIFQFFVHTERIDHLPAWIEFVFNTPSHHRVHHASDRDYLDRNYAGILIVWDRIFGTYAEETHRPTYGLTKNLEGQNPFHLQYGEFRALFRDMGHSVRFRDRWGYALRPPGWHPRDVARNTSAIAIDG